MEIRAQAAFSAKGRSIRSTTTRGRSACAFRLTHPGIRMTGCGRSLEQLGPGSEGHPRGATDARRRKSEEPRRPADRRFTGGGEGFYAAWRVYR